MVSKKSFIMQLDVDPTGAFCSIETNQVAAACEKRDRIEGHCYLWDIAHHENIPFVETNYPILRAIASRFPSQESEDPELQKGGWLLYEYKKSGPKFTSATHEKKVNFDCKKQLDSKEEQENARKALEDAVRRDLSFSHRGGAAPAGCASEVPRKRGAKAQRGRPKGGQKEKEAKAQREGGIPKLNL